MFMFSFGDMLKEMEHPDGVKLRWLRGHADHEAIRAHVSVRQRV